MEAATGESQTARAAIEHFTNLAVGSVCEVTRHEFSWRFRFVAGCWIMIECPWRIVSGGRLVLASRDDRQQFGLPSPVDAEVKATELIGLSPLERLAFSGDTADIALHFRNGTRVDVLNNSSGYEGWQAGYVTGDVEMLIIGCGGGEIAVARTRATGL